MEKKYFPEESAQFKKLLEKLKNRRVAVLGHLRPDGDCIGSQVALCRTLRANGTDAVCVNLHQIPSYLQGFVGDTPFFLPENFSAEDRVAVAVDCSDLERIGDKIFSQFPKIFANIDHHISNTNFAAQNIVLPDAAAACHMLAAFIFDNGMTPDEITAQALYAGIVTDTGQFKYSSTTADVLEIATRLIRCGADVRFTTDNLYEHDNFGRLKLLQSFLSSLWTCHDGRVCIGEIRPGIYKKTGTSKNDTEGFVDYPRCIEGVIIAALLEETDTGVKGSLRAKDPRYRVDKLAEKFNGGGHALAAGFNLKNANLLTERKRIAKIIAAHIDETDLKK